jgi:hypothetical protein|tara:strand:+ start:305 stop:553 length:249 start_codon:yes stop_codon:yes gene_type:complete
MKQMHCNVCEYLTEVDSDSHGIVAKTLAARVELLVIQPIEVAIKILEKIELIGLESLPSEILIRWNQEISQALSFGGVQIDV